MIRFDKDNIFIVTGASSGLGESTAKLLNTLGATVIAVARDMDKLNDVKSSVDNSDTFYVEQFDFKEVENITKFFKNLIKKYGKISGIVHFAGISSLLPIRATSVDLLKETFNVNFFSGYEIVKAVNDKRIRVENASIVLVSSISSIRGFEGLSAYGSSKGAVNSLVVSAAIELAKNKIRINSIVPGHIETSMTQKLSQSQSEEYKKEIINSYPLGEGTPEDISNLTVFLLSNKSRWIMGQNIVIDGGRTLV